jgi:hypothetical protein
MLDISDILNLKDNSERAKMLSDLSESFFELSRKHENSIRETDIMLNINYSLLATQYKYLGFAYKALANFPEFNLPTSNMKMIYDALATYHKNLINQYTGLHNETKDKMYADLKTMNEKYYKAAVDMLSKMK